MRLIDADEACVQMELSSPISDEQWATITDAELERTSEITFETPSGRKVVFIKKRFGEWRDTQPNTHEFKKDALSRMCTACGKLAGKHKYKTYRFCPWCGAEMKEDTDA